jgi:hypothetical protein
MAVLLPLLLLLKSEVRGVAVVMARSEHSVLRLAHFKLSCMCRGR